MAISDESFINAIGDEISRANLVQQMINFYQLMLEVGQTRVTDFNEGSEIRNLLESVAVDHYSIMEQENEQTKIAFIETAEGEWLDKHGANPLINLPREQGTEASGYVTFTIPAVATNEVVIPIGTIVSCTENGLEYETQSDVIIGVGETNTTAYVTSLTVGSDGNCSKDTVTVIEDDTLNIPGLTVNNSSAFTGGTDYMEDEEYKAELLSFVRQNTFGSVGYYEELGASVGGVHDVHLIDVAGYTKKVLVNGYTKPTPASVLLDVTEVFTIPENLVLGHSFVCDKPDYVTLDLDLTLGVVEELPEEDITSTLHALFDGVPANSAEIDLDGLFIGETLTKSSLYNTLELIEGITSVYVEVDGSEFTDTSVDEDEVLALGTITITQNVEE